MSALPLAFAVRLKLDIDPIRSRRVAGIAGTVEALQAASDVELETEAGSVRLKRPALVRGLPFAVLGRPDFFATYRICFEQSIEQMEIEPTEQRSTVS